MVELHYRGLMEKFDETWEEKHSIEVMKFKAYPVQGKSYEYYASIAAKACAKRDLKKLLKHCKRIATMGDRILSPVKLKLIVDFNFIDSMKGFVAFKCTQAGFAYPGTLQSGFNVESEGLMRWLQHTIFENTFNNAYIKAINEFLKTKYKTNRINDESNLTHYYEYCWGINGAEEIELFF